MGRHESGVRVRGFQDKDRKLTKSGGSCFGLCGSEKVMTSELNVGHNNYYNLEAGNYKRVQIHVHKKTKKRKIVVAEWSQTFTPKPARGYSKRDLKYVALKKVADSGAIDNSQTYWILQTWYHGPRFKTLLADDEEKAKQKERKEIQKGMLRKEAKSSGYSLSLSDIEAKSLSEPRKLIEVIQKQRLSEKARSLG